MTLSANPHVGVRTCPAILKGFSAKGLLFIKAMSRVVWVTAPLGEEPGQGNRVTVEECLQSLSRE